VVMSEASRRKRMGASLIKGTGGGNLRAVLESLF
jgi:hypothetical protein